MRVDSAVKRDMQRVSRVVGRAGPEDADTTSATAATTAAVERHPCQPPPDYARALEDLKGMRIRRNESTVHDKCRRKTDADLAINRNSSFPFVTGDTFREIADCILDDLDCPLEPRSCVFEGAIVFVKCGLEEKWFQEYHPQVQHHYVLITHMGDLTVPHSDLSVKSLESPLLVAWFACNLGMRHPKLHAIPHGHSVIGRPNSIPGLYASIWGETVEGLEARWRAKFRQEYQPGPWAIANYFSVGSNPTVRQPVAECLRRQGFGTGRHMPYKELMMELNKYFFVASPPGNGIDCVRTWESFEAAAPPILKKGIPIADIWTCLPVIEVDSYCDLTNELLKSKWEEMRKGLELGHYDLQRVYAHYWLIRIFIAAGRIRPISPPLKTRHADL